MCHRLKISWNRGTVARHLQGGKQSGRPSMQQSPEQTPGHAEQDSQRARAQDPSACSQAAESTQSTPSVKHKGLQVRASIGRVGFQPSLPLFAAAPIFHRQIEPTCDLNDIRIDGTDVIRMSSAAHSDYELGAIALRQAARRDSSWWHTVLAVIGIDWLFTSEKAAQENLRQRAEQRIGKDQHADGRSQYPEQYPGMIGTGVAEGRPTRAMETHAVAVPVWQAQRSGGKKVKKTAAATRPI